MSQTPPNSSPKVDARRLTPEQAAAVQIATIAYMQTIGTILATRLLLFIAVGIGAVLAFMVKDAFSAGVFGAWLVLVIPLLTALDYYGRRKPPGGE